MIWLWLHLSGNIQFGPHIYSVLFIWKIYIPSFNPDDPQSGFHWIYNNTHTPNPYSSTALLFLVNRWGQSVPLFNSAVQGELVTKAECSFDMGEKAANALLQVFSSWLMDREKVVFPCCNVLPGRPGVQPLENLVPLA